MSIAKIEQKVLRFLDVIVEVGIITVTSLGIL